MGGGKGGGQSSSQNQQTSAASSGTSATQLPPWLTGAAQQAVGTAQTLSQNPNLFNQYPGQQVADPGAGTQAAWNAITGSNPNQMANTASGAAGLLYNGLAGAAQPAQQGFIQQGLQGAQSAIGGAQQNAQGLMQGGLLGAQQTEQGAMQGAQGALQNYAGLGPATVGQVGAGAQQLMSPYINNVIGPSMQLGQQALAQNLQQIGAQANQAGAFGGSRQGVMEGVAQSQAALGESNLMANLLNTGWNQALQPSANIALQGGQEGYSAGSTLAQLQGSAGNTLANLQGQGGSTLAQLQSGAGNTLGGMYNTAGTDMAGYGQADITNALTGALPLQQQQIGNLSQMGAQQQSQQQAQLNAQMGNYYGAQQQPIQNLDVLLSTLGGVPYGTSTNTSGSNLNYGNQSVAQQNNPLASGLGGAATGAAIGNLIPGVGPLIGAGAGGLLGALG